MTKHIRMASFGIVAIVTVVAIAITGEDGKAAPSSVVVSNGADRRPSRTAQDWVTYADHVVAVTAVADKPLKQSQEAIDIGEGLILREVTLRVNDVVWSRPDASKPAPSSFTWIADGWQFTNGDTDNRTPMVDLDEPRIESGHSYLMAIDWQPAMCTPGDHIPAQWRGLGDDSTIPFDGQVIGNGEMEGRVQTPDEARSRTDPDSPNYSLEDRMIGKTAADLSRALNDAKPAEAKQYGPPAAQTTCH